MNIVYLPDDLAVGHRGLEMEQVLTLEEVMKEYN